MKLKKEFITSEVDGQMVIVGIAGKFKGIIRANESAAFIVECLKKETTEAEIVDKMRGVFETDRESLTKDVHKILEQLYAAGVIED